MLGDTDTTEFLADEENLVALASQFDHSFIIKEVGRNVALNLIRILPPVLVSITETMTNIPHALELRYFTV